VTSHTASRTAVFSDLVAVGHFANCAFVIAFRCPNVSSILDHHHTGNSRRVNEQRYAGIFDESTRRFGRERGIR
jgi:hypothetical protein